MSIKYNFYLKVLNIVFGEDFWRKNTRSDRETYFHTSEGATVNFYPKIPTKKEGRA